MKLRIEPKALATAVHTVTRSLPARAAVPVLSGAMLDASDDGTLTVSGFDYETSTQVTVPATVLEPGRALVSGRLLGDIAKALPAKPVELVVDGGSRAVIVCGGSRFSLPTMPAEDYPALPEMPPRAGSVDAGTFALAVTQVVSAAGRDDSLPMLTGIRMEIDGPRITLATTDRFRLAVAELAWRPADPAMSCTLLIPATTLAELAKTIANTGRIDLLLTADNPTVGVTADGHRATTRLLNVEFPRFRQLIPTTSTGTATVNVADLIAVVKRVSLMADRTSQISLDVASDRIVVSAGGDDTGSASEHLDCDSDGEPITIGFNAGYLLDALTRLGSPRACLTFTSPMRPAIVRPVHDDDNEPTDGLLYLLMPVRQPG